jgi:hypothetical protein
MLTSCCTLWLLNWWRVSKYSVTAETACRKYTKQKWGYCVQTTVWNGKELHMKLTPSDETFLANVSYQITYGI